MAAVMPITVSVLVQGMRHHIATPAQAVGQDRKECEGIQKTDHELNATGLYLVRQPDILSYTQRP